MMGHRGIENHIMSSSEPEPPTLRSRYVGERFWINLDGSPKAALAAGGPGAGPCEATGNNKLRSTDLHGCHCSCIVEDGNLMRCRLVAHDDVEASVASGHQSPAEAELLLQNLEPADPFAFLCKIARHFRFPESEPFAYAFLDAVRGVVDIVGGSTKNGGPNSCPSASASTSAIASYPLLFQAAGNYSDCTRQQEPIYSRLLGVGKWCSCGPLRSLFCSVCFEINFRCAVAQTDVWYQGEKWADLCELVEKKLKPVASLYDHKAGAAEYLRERFEIDDDPAEIVHLDARNIKGKISKNQKQKQRRQRQKAADEEQINLKLSAAEPLAQTADVKNSTRTSSRENHEAGPAAPGDAMAKPRSSTSSEDPLRVVRKAEIKTYYVFRAETAEKRLADLFDVEILRVVYDLVELFVLEQGGAEAKRRLWQETMPEAVLETEDKTSLHTTLGAAVSSFAESHTVAEILARYDLDSTLYHAQFVEKTTKRRETLKPLGVWAIGCLYGYPFWKSVNLALMGALMPDCTGRWRQGALLLRKPQRAAEMEGAEAKMGA